MIRRVALSDADDILRIYGPIVRDTFISFETSVPSLSEIRRRIRDTEQTHPWLVMENQGVVVGYTYASKFRSRSAYNQSCETTVYVDEKMCQTGIGFQLYTQLLATLSAMNFRTAIAIISLPNAASISLHKKCGFSVVGTIREVGLKFNKWHDVQLWQRHLSHEHSETQ